VFIVCNHLMTLCCSAPHVETFAGATARCLIIHDGAATIRASDIGTGVDAYTVLFESWQQ